MIIRSWIGSILFGVIYKFYYMYLLESLADVGPVSFMTFEVLEHLRLLWFRMLHPRKLILSSRSED